MVNGRSEANSLAHRPTAARSPRRLRSSVALRAAGRPCGRASRDCPLEHVVPERGVPSNGEDCNVLAVLWKRFRSDAEHLRDLLHQSCRGHLSGADAQGSRQKSDVHVRLVGQLTQAQPLRLTKGPDLVSERRKRRRHPPSIPHQACPTTFRRQFACDGLHSITHDRGYAARRLGRILVLPRSDDDPPCCGEHTIVSTVTCDGPCDLCLPPCSIGTRQRPVLWTPVPPATVHHDGDACTRERHVGLAAERRQRSSMYVKPQAFSVQCAPEGDLRRRVVAEVRTHHKLCSGRRSSWRWREWWP